MSKKNGKTRQKTHRYPTWICMECAVLAGKKADQVSRSATWNLGECNICKRKTAVTQPRDFGHFSPDQLAFAKKKVREFGLDAKKFAEIDDVKRLIDVIRGVLGDNMSYMTKLVIRDIEVDMERGKMIDMYSVNQLTYWYAKDTSYIQTLEGESSNDESDLSPGVETSAPSEVHQQ